ncbi:MarC family protein [Bacteroidota bacterium]
MNLHVNFVEIISVTLILFAVIDILGSVPVIIDIQLKTGGKVYSGKATIVAGVLMVLFLFLGESILKLIGIDIASFAIAGAIVIFLLALEMILGVDIFKQSPDESSSTSIVPIAFPLIAGAGTLTTILSIRAEYALENVMIGIVLNLVFVYLVLRSTNWIQNKIGRGGVNVLRKIFGIVLLAIAIKLFRTNVGF